MDIRQSNEYAQFMRSIGWEVRSIGNTNAFIRHFPIIGSFIKIQRPEEIPSVSEIESLRQKEKAFKIVIEPTTVIPAEAGIHKNLYGSQIKSGMTKGEENTLEQLMDNGFKPATPYAPSKTIQIDLTPTLDKIFSSFGKTARWTIKKAEKNNVVVRIGTISEFIKLKVSRFSPFRFSLEKMVRNLYCSFAVNGNSNYSSSEGALTTESRSFDHIGSRLAPLARTINDSNAIMLISYKDSQSLAGVFLLFHDQVAYYWMAAATKEGKELAAPSLLVWEALKMAKEKGCTVFDFEGVFDERFPKQTSSWKGFTKFKEGFGGKEVCFPKPLGKTIVLLFLQN